MDGIHDMGGKHGWGSVTIDPEEPVFRAEWQGRAFALGAMSMGLSGTNLDAFRHGLERLHPTEYLSDGYYGRWMKCAELLLTDSGVIPPGAVEARARQLRGEDAPTPAPVTVNKPIYERGGGGSLRTLDTEPAFAVGQRVTTPSIGKSGHTRLPGYARGRRGVVVAHRPPAVLPDATAHFTGEDPQHVYTVEYQSTELWGPDAEKATVRIDLFESYLEDAS